MIKKIMLLTIASVFIESCSYENKVAHHSIGSNTTTNSVSFAVLKLRGEHARKTLLISKDDAFGYTFLVSSSVALHKGRVIATAKEVPADGNEETQTTPVKF